MKKILEKNNGKVYFIRNTGSVLAIFCGIIPPPAPDRHPPETMTSLVCTASPTARPLRGREGWLRTFFRV